MFSSPFPSYRIGEAPNLTIPVGTSPQSPEFIKESFDKGGIFENYSKLHLGSTKLKDRSLVNRGVEQTHQVISSNEEWDGK
jgi:hypothetical protein